MPCPNCGSKAVRVSRWRCRKCAPVKEQENGEVQYYGVFISDPAKAYDRIIAKRVNRADAEALARKMNAQAVGDRRPSEVLGIPLYYASRLTVSEYQKVVTKR